MKHLRIWACCLLTVFGFSGTASATRTESLARWLFETAKELPRSHAPGETEPEEHARLERVSKGYAQAVVPYADGKGWTGSELAMALLILIAEETKLDKRIHEGTGHPVWHEDHGRSKCLGQVQASGLVPRQIWATLTGSDDDATLRCAEATATVWVSMAKQCGVWYSQRASRAGVAATFMAYGSGGSCTPDERAWSRADKWLARMQKRPDRSPIRGYRRAFPSEIPEDVRREATSLLGSEDFHIGHERRMGFGSPPRSWAFRVEAHADGKIGVSVLLEENPE